MLGSFAPVELFDQNGNPTGYRFSGAGGYSVPEPGTLVLIALGLAGVRRAGRRKPG